MKKVLVVLLVLAVLLSLSSVAFAWSRMPTPTGATVYGSIDKTITQKTEAKTRSGRASSYGNLSANMVKTTSEAKAMDCNSTADNSSSVVAANVGDGMTTTGPAAAANTATNSETDVITGIAEASVTCCMKHESGSPCGCNDCDNGCENGCNDGCDKCDCDCGNGLASVNSQPNGDGHHCDICECCPATVRGDIDIDVKQETKADATSGDAMAKGNMSMNVICNTDQAIAKDGGDATNSSTVMATNTGIATSESGAATSMNNVNNSVYIDIYRSATTSRSISMYLRN